MTKIAIFLTLLLGAPAFAAEPPRPEVLTSRAECAVWAETQLEAIWGTLGTPLKWTRAKQHLQHAMGRLEAHRVRTIDPYADRATQEIMAEMAHPEGFAVYTERLPDPSDDPRAVFARTCAESFDSASLRMALRLHLPLPLP